MKRRGQGVLEYVILLTILIATLLVMGYYIRNTFLGKIREGSDAFGKGEVYRPRVDGVDVPTARTYTVENQ